MSTTEVAKAAADNKPKSAQPMFYGDPVPLLADRHAEAGLAGKDDYTFARTTNSVPINLPEFAESARHYPIAFTADANSLPVAILGVKDKRNLFVDETGGWARDTYVPAYVRRYPFALSAMPDNPNSLILCIDESSPRYRQKAGKRDERFFENGEKTDFTEKTLDFCATYHRDFSISKNFSKALIDNKILIDRQANVKLKDGKTVSLSGFRVIDEAKFAALDAGLLKQWQTNGYLALIYFHFLSITNWPRLADMVAKGK